MGREGGRGGREGGWVKGRGGGEEREGGEGGIMKRVESVQHCLYLFSFSLSWLQSD